MKLRYHANLGVVNLVEIENWMGDAPATSIAASSLRKEDEEGWDERGRFYLRIVIFHVQGVFYGKFY